MSIRVDHETRRRMASIANINWAEVIRETLRERLELEEELRRPINRQRALRAARGSDGLRSKLRTGDFNSTREVRRWRESRK
jgi:hypothetical protein